jgi:hypothetical protein
VDKGLCRPAWSVRQQAWHPPPTTTKTSEQFVKIIFTSLSTAGGMALL